MTKSVKPPHFNRWTPLAEKTEPQQRKRGIRDVIVALVAVALIMSPSYLASIMVSRLRVEISIVAIASLAIFLVGVFLLVQLLKD